MDDDMDMDVDVDLVTAQLRGDLQRLTRLRDEIDHDMRVVRDALWKRSVARMEDMRAKVS